MKRFFHEAIGVRAWLTASIRFVLIVISGLTFASQAFSYQSVAIRQTLIPETRDEMIQKTLDILLVQTLKKAFSKRSERFDYEFKVLKIIKGETKELKFRMNDVLKPSIGQLLEVREASHPNAEFDLKKQEIRMNFAIGEKYLIFVGSKNPYGYQRVASEKEDRWLAEVEKKVRHPLDR